MTRKAGILLHITSLPGKYGVGTLGKEAYDFVDYITKAGFSLWQVLPLYPTGYGDSPYQANSSRALNYYLIDLDALVEEGLLSKEFISDMHFKTTGRVDFNYLFKYKMLALKEAFSNFKEDEEFLNFVNNKEYHEFAIFMTLKEMFNYESWDKWPKDYLNYNEKIEEKVLTKYKNTYLFYQFTQYIFLKQWYKLKAYANMHNIQIIGDIPLYLAYDSSDVYMHKELFLLDKKGQMTKVAGCPPDAFSDDGQLWGNPIYNYKYMALDDYKWWKERIKNELTIFDYLRIDHFRGLDRYYAIPFGEKTARNGKWEKGPKEKLFTGLNCENIIAEDLGVMDNGVIRLLKKTGFPGMKVLEFAFDGSSTNDHKPSLYKNDNLICYTGTHDNSPLLGHFNSLNDYQKEVYLNDLKQELQKAKISTEINDISTMLDKVIELCFASKAKFAIVPLQDLLHLDEDARMNHPSTLSTLNWSYKANKIDFKAPLANKIHKLLKKYKRI